MKIESVVKINIEGEYEVLYMGADRGVARNIFKKALLTCALIKKFIVSSEKAEYVVKAPKKPTITTNASGSNVMLLAAKIVTSSPIKTLPSTFTNNVPYGKLLPKHRNINSVHK